MESEENLQEKIGPFTSNNLEIRPPLTPQNIISADSSNSVTGSTSIQDRFDERQVNSDSSTLQKSGSRKRKQAEPRCIPSKKVEKKVSEYFKSEKISIPKPKLSLSAPTDLGDVQPQTSSTFEGDIPGYDYSYTIRRLSEELESSTKEMEIQRKKMNEYREVIRVLLVEKSKAQRKMAREKNLANQLRIGQFKPARIGEQFRDQWNDGYAMEEITAKLEKVKKEKEDIHNALLALKKKKTAKEAKKNSSETENGKMVTDDGFIKPPSPKEMNSREIYEQEEIYRLRKEHLRKEEVELLMEKDKLERERNLHVKENKRIQYEEQSRFKDHVLLNERYLLMSLLGKGGFSEVWKAYDLDENQYVACKIHHVHKDWKEDKKANYVKHAMREKDIHKSLNHSRIVRLYDLFTIDNDSFCTVLEYCDGNDLDFYLKQHKQIPEKEARSIIMQVVSALKYLNERKSPVIHYDLKPANILLQSGTAGGEIKITDFGLSKTMENSDDGESIELTSQGAGTYWYLPPETFQSYGHGIAPKISSKVDVWSVGVIFYQCLYGKRPFGHERTQQQILQEKTILNACEVSFPQNPKISSGAQDFIRCCLQYNKDDRSDVFQLSKHEYLRGRSLKSV
uniref:Protein kinase domain-containing protein n=1 Tax=Bursaphelenchus xylophilus TaxID=6326 RepID=A0A1I7STD9_BURXY